MAKRVVSASILLLIIVPLILIGGSAFDIGLYIISMIALKEFLDIKGVKKDIPIFIQVIAYIFMTLIILGEVNVTNLTINFDYRLISSLFLSFLIPTVFYHERKTYSINDAFYLIGGILFLSISMSMMIMVRNTSLYLFIFLITLPMITDTFALIGGNLIGKHKLLEEISPNKTVEGMIIGTLTGVFISFTFYITVIDPAYNKIELLFMCTFLSILGQLGDLVFSAIKRYFRKKDFSNLIPGHGGILDRLDSIIFVILGYIFFI
ncbi:MAG: phosphatidate cytidylyltransferase [Bacilli bacterium]|nr:phosphatidate cytidylyltransferase [Bacilli bacterium]